MNPQAIEIQNLTAAVIGLGIALALGLTAIVKWLPDYIKKRADLNIKKEDVALADKQAETKHNAEEWDLLKSSIQTSVQSTANTLQLATQMAIMNQLMERKLGLITGIKGTVEDTAVSLSSLDTFTRENLAPISQIVASIETLRTIAAGNEERGKQIIALLEKLPEQIRKDIEIRKTHGDSEPLKPVITSEVIVTPVELPKASGQ